MWAKNLTPQPPGEYSPLFLQESGWGRGLKSDMISTIILDR